MTRRRSPTPGPHPHPLTPEDLPGEETWWRGCPKCHLPIQGGGAGLAAHRRTVHRDDGSDRITIQL